MPKAPSSLTPLPAPLLFWELCLLSLVAGIIAAAHPLPALCAVAVAVWADCRARGARLLVLVSFLCLGVLLGRQALPGDPPPAPAWTASTITWEGTVAATRGLPDNRLRIILEDVRPAAVPDAAKLPEKLALTWQHPAGDVLPGQKLTVAARIRPVRGFLNGEGPDFAAYWRMQGVGYTAFVLGSRSEVLVQGSGTASARLRAVWRHRLDQALARLDASGAHGLGLIPALLFADQRRIATDTIEQVTKAGIRHSLALSGQHLAVVGLLAFLPVWLLSRLRPALLMLAPRRLLIATCSLPLAALCLWLGDAPPSLMRAALMLALWTVMQWSARPTTLVDMLCMALACMVAFDPLCVFQVGVQLSVLAVAGIGIAQPVWAHYSESWLPGLHETSLWRRLFFRLGYGALWAICLSLAAQAFSLPVILHTFGRATPGLLLNALWLPVLGLIVLPASWLGLLLLMAGWDEAALISLRIADLPCSLLLRGLDVLDRHHWLSSLWSLRPHWTAMLGYGAVLLALAAAFGQASRTAARRLFVAGVLLSLIGPGLRLAAELAPDVAVTVADVGQGQAVLLEWKGGRGLIDGGGFASSRLDSGRDILGPVLTANRAPRLDFVSASHIDRDHVGGLFFLLEHFRVSQYFGGVSEWDEKDPEQVKNDYRRLEELLATRAIPRRNLVAGDRVGLDRETFLETLWPPEGHVLHGNDSLVLRLVHQGRGLAILTGDIEPREQRAMLRLHAGKDISAHLLVIPHHGSRRNLEPALYDAVKPDLAIASTGEGNPWGFPSPEVREALAARGIPLYTTAGHGALRLQSGGGSVTLQARRMQNLPLQ